MLLDSWQSQLLVGSDMTVPDFQTLMLPVLRHAADGETGFSAVEEKLARDFGLSVEDRNKLLPSGRQRVLANRIHWAKAYLTRAGLVDTPKRGVFKASPAGLALLAQQPPRIDLKLLMRYPGVQKFRTASSPENTPTSYPQEQLEGDAKVTPEEKVEAAFASMQSALRSDLIQRILSNSPQFFERVIIDLLVAMGYGGSHRNAAEQLGQAGDGGVDGVINEDRLGLDRVFVQAKRYALDNSVGSPAVQGFVGSLVGRGATKGVFVTTSGFSKQAGEYVRHVHHRVVLIDGEKLADLMIEHNVGVRVSRAVEFKRVDEDFFTEDD